MTIVSKAPRVCDNLNMKYIWITALLLGALFLASCQSTKPSVETPKNQPETTSEKKPERYVKVKSENSFDETYSRLKKSIEEKKPLKVIAELDHSANAKNAELELRPTKIIMFGNPKLGTPLMNINPEIGIDLPQKMLVYENEKGEVFVLYNNPSVLTESHDVSNKEVVTKIAGALQSLAKAATAK